MGAFGQPNSSSGINEASIAGINNARREFGDLPYPVADFVPISPEYPIDNPIERLKDVLIAHAPELFHHQTDAESCYSHSIIHALEVIAFLQDKSEGLSLPHPRLLHEAIPKEYKDPRTGMITSSKADSIGFMTQVIKRFASVENKLEIDLSTLHNSRQQLQQELRIGNIAIVIIPNSVHAVVALKANEDGTLVCIDSLSATLIKNYNISEIDPASTVMISPHKRLSRTTLSVTPENSTSKVRIIRSNEKI